MQQETDRVMQQGKRAGREQQAEGCIPCQTY